MAGPDPRRSARARTSQPVSRPSSTTSSVSGRFDRAPRSAIKAGSPQKSASTGSLTSEPPDEGPGSTRGSPPPTRSRRVAHIHASKDDDQDQDLSSVVASEIEMPNDGDDMQEDDEAVRCICGYDDYPGPPAPEDLKQAAKDGYDVQSIFPSVVTDNLAGFFVQCDICKVWQHGACVGLVNDKTLPEEYYCEECRKSFHKVLPGTIGPRCSIYLALNGRRSRTSSFTKAEQSPVKLRDSSKDGKASSKDTRPEADKDTKNGRPSSSVSLSSKRRSTMNSRDAAYDEEQLRLALEASRGSGSGPTSVDGSSRRPKRGRSDSEEKSDGAKRQRTSSRSASPENSVAADDSDDAMATRNGSSRKLSRNAAAARSQQQRERAEREEKERQRAEAANKRNGRAERRRADDADSDPSEEIPLAATRTSTATARTASNTAPSAATTTATTAAAISSNGGNADSNVSTTSTSVSAPAASSASTAAKPGPTRPSPAPETPPPTSAPAMAASKSKGGRPTHKKKGRNQYTKERDAREEQSATRSRSRDVPENGHHQSRSGAGGGGAGGHGSSNKAGSRTKGNANSRISIPEMRRRMAAMSDFIAKTQVEIAGGEYLAPGTPLPQSGSAVKGGSRTNSAETTPKLAPTGDGDGNSVKDVVEKDFKELPLVDMMDVLTRNIIRWQSTYGS